MTRKEAFEGLKPTLEHCRNPWNRSCKNTDIMLYILYKGDRLPICGECWSKLCESNVEWGENVKPSEKVVVKCMR